MSEQEIEHAPTPLDSLFGDSSTPEPIEETVTGDTEESTPDSTEGEGSEEATAEKAEEGQKEGEGDHKQVPVSALQAERRKRQELEQQLKDLTKETEKRPSVFEDEEAFNKSIDQKLKETEVRTTLQLSHNLLAEDIGQDAVNEMWGKFESYMADFPQLEKEFSSSTHPFKYALQKVEQFERLNKLDSGDIDKEIESRVEALLAEKMKGMDSGSDSGVPKSLAGSAGSGVKSNSDMGQTPLDAVLALPD